jgi:hypothetical protein
MLITTPLGPRTTEPNGRDNICTQHFKRKNFTESPKRKGESCITLDLKYIDLKAVNWFIMPQGTVQ